MSAYETLGAPVCEAGWAEPQVQRGFAEFWDRELFGIDIPPWRRSVVQVIERIAARLPRPVVVADVGCGAAVYARHLLAAGVAFEYHGYDHNAAVLEAAAQRWRLLPGADVRLHRLDANASRWPIADAAFDALIWDTTLRFCEAPRAAFAESARVTRGAIILARTPLYAECAAERNRYYGMTTPAVDWRFDEAALRGMAAAAGLCPMLRAGCDDTHVFARPGVLDAAALPAVQRFERVFHEAFVRERVSRLLADTPGAWAIFGAGRHTRWLASILPAALWCSIRVIIDDDADGAIRGVAIERPARVAWQSLAGVLVSSDSREAELAARAAELARGAAARDVPIQRLYESLPAGPYDKREV